MFHFDACVLLLLLLLANSARLLAALEFSLETENVNLLNVTGQIAAFADFNSDTATDILILNATGNTHNLYLWSTEDSHFIKTPLFMDVPPRNLSVWVGDFDGDGIVDLLTMGPEVMGGECVTAWVHWVSLNQGVPEITDSDHVFNISLSPLVMVMDADGDHVSDVLSTSCNSSDLVFQISQREGRGFVERSLYGGVEPERGGSYNAVSYQDLSSDCFPELVLQRSKGKERWLEVWTRDNGLGFVLNSSFSLPFHNSETTSPLTFIDLDVDGTSEAVVVACDKIDPSHANLCQNASVYIFYQPEGVTGGDVMSCDNKDHWNLTFSKNVNVSLPEGMSVPLDAILSYPVLGDVDLDRYPDLILPVLTNITSNSYSPCVLLSIGSRPAHSLRPQWEMVDEFSVSSGTKLATFDLWEDGVLDLLVIHKDGIHGDRLSALRQSLSADHTFLKVLVLSGHCYTDCSSGVIPYGSTLAAASVAYSTTDRNSHTQQTKAVTRPSSDPLQLPFVLFGLGETPNFIQRLAIGSTYAATSEGSEGAVEAGSHMWRNLVPNSQVIVIPNPPENPGRWRVELYLTPSHLMFTTAGVLCALAIGMAIIIALLHAREKYQDHQERKQAKHKFHFNAM